MKLMFGVEKSKIEKINSELRSVLTGFLNDELYQDTFKDMSRSLGYTGDDADKIKASLFSVNDEGQIGFVIAELNGMFFEYQTIENVKNTEPYKTLLDNYPEKRGEVAQLAKRIINGEEVHQEDIEKVFKVE